MKKILLLFFIPFSLYAQTYDNASEASELCLAIQQNSFINDVEADAALDRILSVIGASKRFILQPCSDISNAVATSYKGLRYILYDRDFMNAISNNTNAWSQLFILAHEVGHHINGHSVDILLYTADIVEPSSLAAKRQQEIESDEFAGFILAKLGATLAQTSEAINLIASDKDDTYSTHPSKEKRLAAIKKGYYKAIENDPVAYENTNNTLTAEEYYYRAYEKAENKDYRGAIADLNKAIEIDPNYAKAYGLRGNLKKRLEDYRGAIADVNKAIEIDPNDEWLFANRGLVKANLGDLRGAIADVNKAIEIDPNYAKAYAARGSLKKDLKDYRGAIADYTKAIEIDPNFAQAYAARGLLKLYLGQLDGGCLDLSKAGELGDGEAYDLIKEYCN
jgi:tetratricopeptide (TPR) repeat protein